MDPPQFYTPHFHISTIQVILSNFTQTEMFFPPFRAHLPRRYLMESLPADRLSWIAGYDIEKHEWITFEALDPIPSAYDSDAWKKLVKDRQTKDLIQSILNIIGCSPGSPQPEQIRQGMNIFLKGSLGTGRKTAARAICNMLKRPLLDILALNDMPCLADVRPWAAKVASIAIKWNAVLVIDRVDTFMRSKYPESRERINIMMQEFEAPGCICMWPSVVTDEQQTLFRPFVATIRFPDLDQAARRQRLLQRFGLDDLAANISSSEHTSVPTVRDSKTLTFLQDIEDISWYELDGLDIDDYMLFARDLARGQKPTPQHMKAALNAQGLPPPVRN